MRCRECVNAHATTDICALARRSSWAVVRILRSCRPVPITLWFPITIRLLCTRVRGRASLLEARLASVLAWCLALHTGLGAGDTTALPGTVAWYSSITHRGSAHG